MNGIARRVSVWRLPTVPLPHLPAYPATSATSRSSVMTTSTIEITSTRTRGSPFFRFAVVAATLWLTLSTAHAATFGPMQLAYNVRVASIFRGAYGPAYVTFTPAILTGCNGNYGGYLSAGWAEAISWTPDPAAAKDQLALLMLAKATDAPLEVRFRVNTSGTGWDKCAIDAVWVQQ